MKYIKYLFGIFIVLISSIITFKYMDYYNTVNISKYKLHLDVDNKLSKYKYGMVVIDKEDTYNDNKYIEEQIYCTDKDNKFSSYIYRNNNEDILYQCWDKADIGYNNYTYVKDLDKWVITNLSSVPYSAELWELSHIWDNYELANEYVYWNNTTKCYLLYYLATSEVYDNIYEEIYIDVKTKLPVGIISYRNIKQDTINSIDSISGEYDGAEIEKSNIEISDYNSTLIRYEFNYSNNPLYLIDKPEEYIDVNEYNKLMEMSNN